MNFDSPVSVVLLTYNAAPYLPNLISSLKQQTLIYELIVIDSESTDGTQEILNSNSIAYKSIAKKSFNHGSTRNLALSYAKHNLVIFLTQDAIPASPFSFEIILNSLTNNINIAIAYGRQLPYKEASYFAKFARNYNYPVKGFIKNLESADKLGPKTYFISNSFAAYKKNILLEAGGFPEHVIMGEDAYAAAKVIIRGYSIVYSAEAHVIHSHNYSVFEEFKRYFDIGVFHSRDSWLLSSFSSVESEGLKYVHQELTFLLKNNQYHLLPEFLLRSILKYIGYRLGIIERLIPIKIKKRISMHSFFWN